MRYPRALTSVLPQAQPAQHSTEHTKETSLQVGRVIAVCAVHSTAACNKLSSTTIAASVAAKSKIAIYYTRPQFSTQLCHAYLFIFKKGADTLGTQVLPAAQVAVDSVCLIR